MSYLVLARKYRPQKFDDLIGQEHIVEILKKSISGNRVAHAYLFCGPRGIGKTSCARIFAKALNCKNGPTVNPCGECPACQEIAKSTSFDVIEIDGASNRGIDEIRTLRENVKFAPNYGRYKIYIVDEVHMLTTEAFNALLKTLEEPPEHVKFVFATTAPNKLPSTIISRCQRFDFKRVSVNQTMKALAAICTKENFKIDESALFAVAKAAEGSLRDSLSILDQLSALSDRQIKSEDVYSMLGLVETQFLFELTDALGDKNCQQAFEVLDKVISQGKDIKQLTKDVTEHFRNLMVIKVGGKTLGKLVDYPISVKDMLLAQTEKFTLKEILKAIEFLVESQEVSRITESLRMPLEVAFAKITYRPEGAVSRPATASKIPSATPAMPPKIQEKPSAAASTTSKPSALESFKNQKGEINLSLKNDAAPPSAQLSTLSEPAAAVYQETSTEVLDIEKVKKSWDAITFSISKERMSVATFLQEGSPYDVDGSKLTIAFPKTAVFHKESLEHNDVMQLIERNFSEKLRQKVRIELRLIENFKPQDDEPFIKEALDTFKGRVVNKWHKE